MAFYRHLSTFSREQNRVYIRIFLYLLSKFLIICSRKIERIFLVRNMWHYNLNVNAPLSRILHTLIHLVINNKIRRHYISIFRRIVQIIYIRTLSDINFIKRSIAERYYKSVRTYGIFFDAWIYSPQSSMCSSFTFHISRNIAVNPKRPPRL